MMFCAGACSDVWHAWGCCRAWPAGHAGIGTCGRGKDRASGRAQVLFPVAPAVSLRAPWSALALRAVATPNHRPGGNVRSMTTVPFVDVTKLVRPLRFMLLLQPQTASPQHCTIAIAVHLRDCVRWWAGSKVCALLRGRRPARQHNREQSRYAHPP